MEGLKMFRIPEDNTFNEIREKSLMSWLAQVRAEGNYEDASGAELAMDYIQFLQDKVKKLEEKNRLKERYLKQMKKKLDELK